MAFPIRFHFLADTHLGFDLPGRPRVPRRRRGHDFFANFSRVLDAAVHDRVAFLVHGGDVFYRSRVSAALVQRVFLSLKRVADTGIPVILVPGNHERSRIPYPTLAEHPGIHILDRAATVTLTVQGVRVALAGFPYHRHDVRRAFPDLVRATDWAARAADVSLLCVHHCFEGATVGPGNFTFRGAADVVRHHDVPVDFAAVLSGHIHRHQFLTRDLDGQPLAVPVAYPGSIERTSYAEVGEPKGFLAGEIDRPDRGARPVIRWQFRELPARPMAIADLVRDEWTAAALESAVRKTIAAHDPESVLRVRILGEVPEGVGRVVAAERLRAMAPPTMNVDVTFPGLRTRSWTAPAASGARPRRERRRDPRHDGQGQLSLS